MAANLLHEFGTQALVRTVEASRDAWTCASDDRMRAPSSEELRCAARTHGLHEALAEPLAPARTLLLDESQSDLPIVNDIEPSAREASKPKKPAQRRLCRHRIQPSKPRLSHRQKQLKEKGLTLERRAWTACRTSFFVPNEETKITAATMRDVQLEWVCGYDTAAPARNLVALSEDQVLWFVDNVVIVYNVSERTQRIFRGHRYKVTCVAVDEAKQLCASGEACATPSILVWRIGTLEVEFRLGMGFFTGPRISAVAISSESIVGVDNGALSVGYWRLDELRRSAKLLVDRANSSQLGEQGAHWGGLSGFDHHADAHLDRTRVPDAERRADALRPANGTGTICDMCWHQGDDHQAASWSSSPDEELAATFVTVGPKRHVRFWRYITAARGTKKLLETKSGVFLRDSDETMLRCAYLPSRRLLLTLGQRDRCVYAWRGRVMFDVYSTSRCSAITVDDRYFVLADESGAVRTLLPRGTKTPEIVEERMLPARRGHADHDRGRDAPAKIRDVARFQNTTFAATFQGVLWAICSTGRGTRVVLAAPQGPRSAVAAIGTSRVAVVSNGALSLYDLDAKLLERWRPIKRTACCVCVADDLIGVGFDEGVALYDAATLDERGTFQSRSVECIAISSLRTDHRLLAIGCRDGTIHVVNCTLNGVAPKVTKPCSARVLDIDFDASARYLRASSRAKELVWLDTHHSCHQVGPSDVADLDWGERQTARSVWGQVTPSRLSPNGDALAVVDTADLSIVGNAKAPHHSAMSISWITNDRLATCGQHSLFLWRTHSGTRRSHRCSHRCQRPPSTNCVSSSRLALCHLCGRYNAGPGFAQHLDACERQWRRGISDAMGGTSSTTTDSRALQRHLPLPPRPQCVRVLQSNFNQLSSRQIAHLNRQAQQFYLQHVLVRCAHCGRAFTRPALAKHNVACTSTTPYARAKSATASPSCDISSSS